MKNNSTKTNLTQESVSKGRKLKVKGEAVDKYAHLLYCSGCRYPLVMKQNTSKGRFYSCSLYQNSEGKLCMSHRISEKQLDRAVLQVLQYYAEAARKDPEKFRKQIFSELYQSDCLKIQTCHCQIRQRQRKIIVINRWMKELSVKYSRGKIEEEKYHNQMERYETECAELSKAIMELQEKHINEWIEKFICSANKHIDIQNLTAEILRAFVDEIVVFKNPPKGTTTSDGHEIGISLCCGLKVGVGV